MVRRTAEDNRSLFEKSQVDLQVELYATPITVCADRTRMAQVISNLLQNAAKFTPAGGRTRISVEAAGETATVRVIDNGVGMAEATLQRLFQPFAQAAQSIDRSGGGLGLGLALVKGLVELHGGRVAARSDGLGKGSEFIVELACEIGASARLPRSSLRVVRESRRILIIEDNRDAAESLCEVLELDGHEVAVAHDGAQGLRKALDFKPDVVLCDIGLPGMDGYEVARALRADERLRSAHLVAISGYALPEDLCSASQAGFQDHLAKPPSIERLAEILSRVP
jgi:two-component system CheB/CheR fusion protein